MSQLRLFGEPEGSDLTCALGEPWMGEHPKCDAEVEKAVAWCEAEIEAGRLMPSLHTPKEWAWKQKQEKKR